MLLNFLYNKTEDEKYRLLLNNQYQDMLHQEIIPSLQKKIDIYEIEEGYRMDIQRELNGFKENLGNFPEYFERFNQILQKLGRYERDASRELERNLFTNDDIRAVEKSKAIKYRLFFQELYKHYIVFCYVFSGAKRDRKFKTFRSNLVGRWNAFLLDVIDVREIVKSLKNIRP